MTHQLPREITDFLTTMRGRPQSRSPERQVRLHNDYQANPFDGYPARRPRPNTPTENDRRGEIPFHGYNQRQLEQTQTSTSYRNTSPNEEIRFGHPDLDVDHSVSRNPFFRERSPESSNLRETNFNVEYDNLENFQQFEEDQERLRYLEESQRIMQEENCQTMNFEEDLRMRIPRRDFPSPVREDRMMSNSESELRNRLSNSPVRANKNPTAEKRSKSRDKTRSKHVNKRRSKSPNKRRPRSPNKRRSVSPNKLRSRSPNRHLSKSERPQPLTVHRSQRRSPERRGNQSIINQLFINKQIFIY
jgi:hypothetical protein